MGRNLSFHYVIKNVREREGTDISSLILKVKNQDVVSLDVEEVSKEYKDLTEKYKQISRRQSSGEEPSAEDQHTVALWGQAHDKAQAIIQEAYDNIWFFFREILRLPHDYAADKDIPTDMRDPDDCHFQMSEYGVKILWLYENGLIANMNYCQNISIYELFAGIGLYEMFRTVVDYKKTGSIDGHFPMLVTRDASYMLSIVYLKITNIMWLMIHELEYYSFLTDIADTMLDIMDEPFNDSTGVHTLRPIKPVVLNGTDNETLLNSVKDYKGFVLHHPDRFKGWITKRPNSNAGLLNLITASPYNFKCNPELTFEYIMKDTDGYYAKACRAVFNINAGILEFIDSRVPHQRAYIQAMVHNYNAILHSKDFGINVDSVTSLYRNRIGYIDSSLLHDNADVYEDTKDMLNYIYSKYTK